MYIGCVEISIMSSFPRSSCSLGASNGAHLLIGIKEMHLRCILHAKHLDGVLSVQETADRAD